MTRYRRDSQPRWSPRPAKAWPMCGTTGRSESQPHAMAGGEKKRGRSISPSYGCCTYVIYYLLVSPPSSPHRTNAPSKLGLASLLVPLPRICSSNPFVTPAAVIRGVTSSTCGPLPVNAGHAPNAPLRNSPALLGPGLPPCSWYSLRHESVLRVFPPRGLVQVDLQRLR